MNIRKNSLEWSVFAAALLVVGGCVALLVVEMVRSRDAPAELAVRTGAAERAASGYRVPVLVRNEGDRTAAEVHIELALERAGEDVERANLSLPFVPRQSEREAVVVFRQDPSCCRVVVRVLGYETP